MTPSVAQMRAQLDRIQRQLIDDQIVDTLMRELCRRDWLMSTSMLTRESQWLRQQKAASIV